MPTSAFRCCAFGFIAAVLNARAPQEAVHLATVHWSFPGTIPIFADYNAVVEVVDNFLSNAVKYSPPEKNIFVRCNLLPACARVEVQDEGEGISPHDIPKLFGKFARLSACPTGGEHSTGLGLSIVKKMVEVMDGNVWCESE